MPKIRRSSIALAVVFTLAATTSTSYASRPAPTAHALLSQAEAWDASSVVAIGSVRSAVDARTSAGNILAVYFQPGEPAVVRVSLVAPVGIHDRVPHFLREKMQVRVLFDDSPGGDAAIQPGDPGAPGAWDRQLVLDPAAASKARLTLDGVESALSTSRVAFHLERGWMAAALPAGARPGRISVITMSGGREIDRVVATLGASGAAVYEANVAFMHHGNQGLAYSDVFKGRSGAEEASGFDEILEVHEQKNIPVNAHLGGLLQSSAEWNFRNGDPLDFNGWMRAGVTAGWLGIITSAYAQPMLPFLQGAMNDWAIDRQVDMDTFRYNYVPRVAWIPERVWLTPGQAPSGSVIDATRNHWQTHGVNAVILDDSPHCNGHDSHQIHTDAPSGLRIIPRDGYFTGRMHVGDGAGALAVLTGLASSGLGTFRLVTYADDWEQAAEMGNWATDFPFALDTYLWMIDKCQTESAWLRTWKLDPALANPNFNGDTFTPVNATYGGIGDVNGYGGNNNAWYSDWAGYVPYTTGGVNGACGGSGNCKNHGTLWNDAHAALQAAPDNAIREAGWYVLMTNLHETGWHDYLGGPISGWQRQYAAHIKNANVYAEAARWAGGQYASATGAFTSDIDNDGIAEMVMHNDRLFAVFESIGGRCVNLFAKGADYAYPVVGIDNAYWAGTEGDYNDVNHIGALSDVGQNFQHNLYAMQVDVATGGTVQATFTHGDVRKTIRLTLGQPYLDCVYRTGARDEYIQSGWSPDVVDLLYNARMDRVWGGGNQTYMGQRNPGTRATAAYVLGQGGATFNVSFSSTLLKADEIKGSQKFQFYVYGGYTSDPDGGGNIAELSALSLGLTDQLAPEAVRGTYFPALKQLVLTFDEAVRHDPVVATSIAIDSDNNGTANVTLDGSTAVLTASPAATLTLQVSNAVHNAIQALPDRNSMRLLLTAGAVRDVANNPVATLTNTGNVMVSYGPPTLITLDGRFDPSEWPTCTVAHADSFDSAWNPVGQTTNEIQALYATWDSTYLYLGIRGIATSNSWLLYLDTDPGGPDGPTDLRAIDAWERGVQLTAPGFKPDWQFGAYQHQSAFDSQSFFKITSATTTTSYSDSILKAFDPGHGFGLLGGSEIAIPWSTLFGLGGGVPAFAQIGLAATLCYDPEPGGEAGGDQAPNNLSSLPPTLDNRVLIAVDGNGDGVPDPIDRTPPALISAAHGGNDSTIVVEFHEPVTAAAAQTARYTVFETGNPGATLTVESATLLPGNTHVMLGVSGMSFAGYTVVANGIADATCYANVASQTEASFQGPPVGVEPRAIAAGLRLSPPLPNPMRSDCSLEYTVPAAGDVSLDIFDLRGRHVRGLVRGPHRAGTNRVVFDGRDDRGADLAPGVFFVRLSRGIEQTHRRLVLLP